MLDDEKIPLLIWVHGIVMRLLYWQASKYKEYIWALYSRDLGSKGWRLSFLAYVGIYNEKREIR